MKKAFIIILACFLIICTITACGSSAANTPDEVAYPEIEVAPEDTSETIETEISEEIEEWEYEPKYTFERIPWVEAYREYLLDFINNDRGAGDATFGLFYIDSDDIPELVVAYGHSHYVGCSIVSYIDGELVISDPIGQFGYFEFAERQGIVLEQHAANLIANGADFLSTTVYRLRNGVLTDPHEYTMSDHPICEDEVITGFQTTYRIDDAEVSEAAYTEAVAQHVPSDLKTTGNYFEWMALDLDARTVNYFFDAYSADEDVIAHAEDEDFSISGYLEEKQYYASFGDWGENHYVYMLRLPEPLPVYFENQFFFLKEIQVEQFYMTRDRLGTDLSLSGEVSPARTPYHHSPFIIMPYYDCLL